MASKTWGDSFGVLLGVAGVKQKTRIDGFESIGWTNGTVDCPTCVTGAGAGDGFFYASVVPNNTGHGLTPGTPVDLSATSGLSLPQLDSALIPRLDRNSLTLGTRSRWSAILSLEYRPTDTLHIAIDSMYAKSIRDYQRLNMNWYVRNSGPGTSPTSTGGMVPFDITTDSNNVVTSGTFANSSFFLENDIFNQKTKFWNINPEVTWQPTPALKVDGQVNYGHSTFFREQPQFDFQTPYESGLSVDYTNDGKGLQPQIVPNVDLNDPNLGWRWYRVNIQNVARKATTKGAHLNVTAGDDNFNVKVGGAYDQTFYSIRAFDNSTAFQTAVCGATCDGTTGLVPNSALAQYLRPMGIDNFGHLAQGSVGYSSYIQTNLKALEDATNFAYYNATAPETRSSVTGGPTGDIHEKDFGAYFEINGVTQIFGRDLHVNVGTRYYHTDQRVVGPVQLASGLVDVSISKSYDGFLPQANLAYDVTNHLKLRFAASQTMTRPDVESLLPGTTFSDISAQVASAGNPDLRPYTSSNLDIGGEYYTGGSGYVGVDYFHKVIDGFTENVQNVVPFSSLGIPFDALETSQQQALNQRGGPDLATVVVTQPVNLSTLTLNGVELTWVQPLDFLVHGLGFSANGTHITQSSASGLFASGIPPYSYNLQAYYEAHGISLNVNYVWTDKFTEANAPQNNVNVPLIADSHGQLDISAGYQLPFWNKAVRLTVDAQNDTNEPIRDVFGYSNATNSVYYPGRQILFGIRAGF